MHDQLVVWYLNLGRAAAALLAALLALRIVESDPNWRRNLPEIPTGSGAAPDVRQRTAVAASYGIWRRSTTPAQADRLCARRRTYAEAEVEQRRIARAARQIGQKGCFYVKKD